MAGEIKHSWNGTVLTITSDSGTSSADLKGEKGDTGVRGAQGVRGLCGLSANTEVDTETLNSFELKENRWNYRNYNDLMERVSLYITNIPDIDIDTIEESFYWATIPNAQS